MNRLSSYVVIALCCALQVLQVTAAQGEEPSIEERIRAAWQKRAEELKNFQCTASLHRIRHIPLDGGDLFGVAEPGDNNSRPIGLDTKFTLTMSRTKIAVESNNEVWDSSSQSVLRQNNRRCFDGAINKELIIGQVVNFPVALVSDDTVLGEELSRNTNFYPVCLTFYPGDMVTRDNFDLSRMAVSDDRAFHQGVECIQVAIPRDSGGSCHVYVDPSRGYLPMRFVEWRTSGEKRYDIEFEYAENEELGWTIASWVSNQYGDGKVYATSIGTVTSTAINEQLKDDAFDITFPVGTRIRETLNGETKSFIQEANGVRRERTRRAGT